MRALVPPTPPHSAGLSYPRVTEARRFLPGDGDRGRCGVVGTTMLDEISADVSASVDRSAARRRVAIVMVARNVSGAEHQTLALARALSQLHEVCLLTSDEFASAVESDSFLKSYASPVQVRPLGPAFPEAPTTSILGILARAVVYPRMQMRLRKALRAFKPDVTHLVLSPSFFAYAPWFVPSNRGVWRRSPTVVTLAGEARYALYYYGRGKRLAVRWASRRATALVACSADEAENLRALSPRDALRATVIDNFTDIDRFRPDPTRQPLVVFAARLHPEKGALRFLEAMAIVHRQRPDARIALFGRGEEEAEVAASIIRHGLTGAVERGFVADMAPIFARASVFVSCQVHENLGSSSLLEAMASGAAIVATDVGSTYQIVDDSVGKRVAPTPRAIASAVLELLDDQARRDACGAAARRRVVERYSVGPYLARLQAVYEAAIFEGCGGVSRGRAGA
jgi:glycosyltransferase involved in cell wall biosynthesis